MTDHKIVLKELSDLIEQKCIGNVKDIILFGSQVYGTPKEDSDYDFLIILKQKVDWKTERIISDACYEIELKFDILTDTHIISEAELSTLRGLQPIYTNAIQNGLHIYG